MANLNITMDASAAISVLVNEASKPDLLIATAGRNLIAPNSVFWEVGNAFSAMLKRQALPLRTAIKALDLFNSLPIRYVDVNLSEALQVAHDAGIYAYDAYLLVCARTFNAPLLTLDKALKRAAISLNIKIVEY